MAQPTVRAIIYRLYCIPEDKVYIGHTVTHKKKGEKYYRYGIAQRLAEHVGSARRDRTTPICIAIREHDITSFEIDELERCDLVDATTREMFHIEDQNSLVPHGYNVQAHSSRTLGGLPVIGIPIKAEIKGINCNGELAKIRVMITCEGETTATRYMFYGTPENFNETLDRARNEVRQLLDEENIHEHSSLIKKRKLWWPYNEKISQFDDDPIVTLRVTLFDNNKIRLVAKTQSKQKWKDQPKITFGGKNITVGRALQIASSCIKEINKRNTIDDIVLDERLFTIKGLQQAAARLQGINSETA